MIKLEQVSRRHVVGLSALALTLAALGFAATLDFRGPQIAALPEAKLAQRDMGGSFEEILSGLRRLPANAFGSAKAIRPSAEPGRSSAEEASADANPSVSPSSEAKFWSDQEWRIANKAVEDFRGARKTQRTEVGTLSWRPPEEIAQKARQPH